MDEWRTEHIRTELGDVEPMRKEKVLYREKAQ